MESIIKFFDPDKAIVLAFLIITLIVGIIAGRDIKNIKDYTIANKSYSTPVLALTLLATMIGGGTTTGDTAQFFQDGLVYLIPSLAIPIAIFLAAKYIAPKFDNRFDGMISVSDIIKYFYGVKAEVFSGLVGYAVCLGVLGVQFTALGSLMASFLSINYSTAIYTACSLIVCYSTFGGIKSVTMTDVLQFAILIVVIPLVASVAITEVGGLAKVFSNPNLTYHFHILSHPKFDEYIALFLFMVIPLVIFQPHLIQRYLMAQNHNQLSRITYIYSFLSFALIFIVVCMAFSALKLFPNIEPKAVIPTIIDNLLPPFMKGVAISGMIAVIMSTADSSLNSAGILIAHNVFPEKYFNTEIGKLNLMKVSTLITGALGIFISLQNYNIVSLLVITSLLLVSSIGIPLLFGLLKFKVSKESFWVCNLVSIMSFLVTEAIGLQDFSIPIIIALLGFIGFISTHIIQNRCIAFVGSKVPDKKKNIKFNNMQLVKIISKYLPTPKNIYQYSNDKVKRYGANYLMFGIFCCINYVVPYFMWTYQEPTHYLIMLELRIFAGMLCVGLLMKDYWPEKLKHYFPLYWHFTLMYCLPFVTTVMLIILEAHYEWLINLTLSIMLLTMLVDWLSFILISLAGMLFGFLFYELVIGDAILPADFETIYLSIYVCLFASLIGILFARPKELNSEEKLEAMQLFGGAIAHEVKTPLATINMGAQYISLLAQKVMDKKQAISSIAEKDNALKALQETCILLKKASIEGISTVDRLLTSLKAMVIAQDKDEYSIKECLEETIKDFMVSTESLGKVNINIENDIIFYGSKHYIKHVLYNLFSNALKHGGSNVEIDIWSEDHKLYFKDYGKGISKEDLPHIFERFYTKSSKGTGIGLSFCKMVMEEMGGALECRSELGKYTEFILKFA
ncbi:hypothetical protein H1Q59_01450 [Holosporaceae bacterium 'Namur']|nr:hypothetical protein [Holosporaceae bacterium 'Namur']